MLHEPAGRGGSDHLHRQLHEGDRVTVSWPRNKFRFRSATKYRFIAAGIGITPLMPMLRAAADSEAEWELLYLGRSYSSMAFLHELEMYGDRVRIHPSDENGRVDLHEYLAETTADTLLYCCGPATVIDAVEQASAHWPEGSLHVEHFSPRRSTYSDDDSAFDVEFVNSATTLTVPPHRTILEVAREAGISRLSSCEEGVCGTCETRILTGVVDHRDSVLTDAEQQTDETMMVCVSRAQGGCPRLKLDA